MSARNLSLYWRNKGQQDNCDAFLRVADDYPNIKFFQPNVSAAPWHVQAGIEAPDGIDIVLNFWPHKLKGHREGCPTAVGKRLLSEMIEEALDDADLVLIE